MVKLYRHRRMCSYAIHNKTKRLHNYRIINNQNDSNMFILRIYRLDRHREIKDSDEYLYGRIDMYVLQWRKK